MAIDTTPSTVATSALQAIPFSSLIGGPLDACIKAQANSAMTSWQFINEVGLYTDQETGEKKAVQVVFQYNSNGQMTTLVVPLLTIVPIPYLAIDAVTIDFIANISASASNVQENSNDTDLNVNATAEASIGVGPFSLKINASASYSSKQHSKASQESKYSVEYTMNVHVEGGQADMPQGLGTILNILQGSVTSNNASDLLTVIPNRVYFNTNQSSQTSQQIQVTLKDMHGVVVPGVPVTATITASTGDDPFASTQAAVKAEFRADHNSTHPARVKRKLDENRFLTRAEQKANERFTKLNLYGKSNNLRALTDPAAATTDDQGQATFTFTLNKDIKPGAYSGIIEFDATVKAATGSAKDQQSTSSINYIVIIPQPTLGNETLKLNQQSVEIAVAGTGGAQTVSVTASGYPDDATVTVNISADQALKTLLTLSKTTVTLQKSNNFTDSVGLSVTALPATTQVGVVTFADANNNTSLATLNVTVDKNKTTQTQLSQPAAPEPTEPEAE